MIVKHEVRFERTGADALRLRIVQTGRVVREEPVLTHAE